MKTPHLVGICGGLLAAAALSGEACTYNTYNILQTSSAGGGMASSASHGSKSSTDSSSDGVGGMSSASASAGGAGGGAASSSSGMCSTDADSDGAISWQCIGGKDCADEDPNAHPEPMVTFQGAPIQGTKKPGTLNFDFNCDGAETAETPMVKCGLGCDPPQKIGFQNVVACGAKAPLGHCAAITCAFTPENPPTTLTQRCK